MEGVGVGVVLSLGGGGLWLLGRRSLPPCSFPPLGIRLRDAFYDELHWAFYRALPLLLFASRYTGTFAGAGLVLLEALLDPHVRWQLRDPDHNPYLVLRGLTWVVSLLLFLATGNLWLSGLVHLLLVWKLA
ncbi:MAG TPA: hypothetical protein ENK56_08045 [Chloroflexi bacterium]|nr:hypothetical protein [Chloroflexota bacterium]